MDDLWKALAPRIEARPDLAAGGRVFRHRHHARGMDGRGTGVSDMRIARQRQRTADETGSLGEPPACRAHPRFQDFAGVHDRLPAGEALAEAASDREREREPFLLSHQRPEPEITQFVPWFGPWVRLWCDRASEDFCGNCGRTHAAPPGMTISVW